MSQRVDHARIVALIAKARHYEYEAWLTGRDRYAKLASSLHARARAAKQAYFETYGEHWREK